MKRWTLLLFLLLLPFTMAPRTSLTPVEGLEVVLVASRTSLQSGDVVNVVGQARNTSGETVAAPVIRIYIRGLGDKLAATLERGARSGCQLVGNAVECTVRDLKPRQQAAFSIALRLTGDGSAQLTTQTFGTAAPSESITLTVTGPAGGDRG